MKNIAKILFLMGSLLACSCSDFLDRDPDFVTPPEYYNTENEMQQALNGVYNRLIDKNGRMYSKGLFSYFAISDELFYKNVSTTNIKVMEMDAADLDIGRFWEVLYEGINRANLLLKYSNFGDISTNSNKRAIKGEAMFMRGYYYFLLTSFFGEVPLKLTPTESPSDKYLGKSSLQAIYAQIVDDMSEGSELMKNIDELPSNERISKTGAQAILARVYLKMAGEPLKDESAYTEALKYANMVIASTKHSLNPVYSDIFTNHCQDINEPKECLWEVGMYGNSIGNVDLSGMVGVENGILCPSEDIGYSGGAIQITAKIYESYGSAADLRRDWSIAPYRYINEKITDTSTGLETTITKKKDWAASEIYNRNPGKWRRELEKGQKARSRCATNFPIIRYSDVLLMKAEAEAAVNGVTQEAYDAINQVRRRAYGKPIDVANATCDIAAGLDAVKFMEKIRDERLREFAFEGMRKLDLIRWGLYVTTMNAEGNKIATSAPAAFKYAGNAGKNTTARNVVFPIPNTEIMVNKLMTQNKDW